MFKKFYDKIKEFIKEEYKSILVLLALYIILSFPVNYSIIVGGGISNIDSRVKVEDAYKSKGSFNISYVTEMRGTVFTYLLSYVVPDYKRVSLDEYKYDKEEDYNDIKFRSDIDLTSANNNAIKVAYSLANKDIKKTSTKIYITMVEDDINKYLNVGDELLSIDGKKFDSTNDYRKYLQTMNEGDSVKVEVLRKDKKKAYDIKIKNSNNRKIIGVVLQEIHKYKTTPSVNIKFKSSESGPSGGLIATLDIYNKLTKKDLTNSLKIAGTGTVDSDGNVGQIGEVKYKLLGAVKKKADIFLVPTGDNYNTCIKTVKEKKLNIKVIGVKSVSDAIEKLESIK